MTTVAGIMQHAKACLRLAENRFEDKTSVADSYSKSCISLLSKGMKLNILLWIKLYCANTSKTYRIFLKNRIEPHKFNTPSSCLPCAILVFVEETKASLTGVGESGYRKSYNECIAWVRIRQDKRLITSAK